MQKDMEEIVSKNVLLISQKNFDRMIFRENLEKYYNFIRSKLADFSNDYHD